MWECFRLVEYRFMWTLVLLNWLFVAKWAKCLKFVIINCFAPPPWENLDQKGLTLGHLYIFLVRFKKEEKSKQHFLPIFLTFSSCPAFAFKRSVYRALTTGWSNQRNETLFFPLTRELHYQPHKNTSTLLHTSTKPLFSLNGFTEQISDLKHDIQSFLRE